MKVRYLAVVNLPTFDRSKTFSSDYECFLSLRFVWFNNDYFSIPLYIYILKGNWWAYYTGRWKLQLDPCIPTINGPDEIFFSFFMQKNLIGAVDGRLVRSGCMDPTEIFTCLQS